MSVAEMENAVVRKKRRIPQTLVGCRSLDTHCLSPSSSKTSKKRGKILRSLTLWTSRNDIGDTEHPLRKTTYSSRDMKPPSILRRMQNTLRGLCLFRGVSITPWNNRMVFPNSDLCRLRVQVAHRFFAQRNSPVNGSGTNYSPLYPQHICEGEQFYQCVTSPR